MKNKLISLAIVKYRLILKWLGCASPLMMFLLRLWVASQFWVSGLQKIRNFDNAVQLFTDEYKVPLLSPYLAAVMSVTFELSCPVLLVLGLASRFAALALLGMTGVIYFTYDQSPEVTYWALALGMILFYGPNKLSLDHLICKKLIKE